MLNTGTYVSTGPVEVSQSLQDGEKFIKWDDVSKMVNLMEIVSIVSDLKPVTVLILIQIQNTHTH